MLEYHSKGFYNRYKVMLATWRDDPDDRPTFTQLASIMGDFLEENVKQVKTKTIFFKVTQLQEFFILNVSSTHYYI